MQTNNAESKDNGLLNAQTNPGSTNVGAMITREELKNEVDRLPDGLLDKAYVLLKKLVLKEKISQQPTIRDFHGKLDYTDIRKAEYDG
jgi:hypothetical protein